MNKSHANKVAARLESITKSPPVIVHSDSFANSTETYPTFTIVGPGSVEKITNITTGKFIAFSNLILGSAETLTIDLSPGVKSVISSTRGNLIGLVDTTSDLDTFTLIPGANSISVQIASTATSATCSWT